MSRWAFLFGFSLERKTTRTLVLGDRKVLHAVRWQPDPEAPRGGSYVALCDRQLVIGNARLIGRWRIFHPHPVCGRAACQRAYAREIATQREDRKQAA